MHSFELKSDRNVSFVQLSMGLGAVKMLRSERVLFGRISLHFRSRATAWSPEPRGKTMLHPEPICRCSHWYDVVTFRWHQKWCKTINFEYAYYWRSECSFETQVRLTMNELAFHSHNHRKTITVDSKNLLNSIHMNWNAFHKFISTKLAKSFRCEIIFLLSKLKSR